MPAIGHQATAYEGDIGQRIEEQQLTHGVAQQHGGFCIHRLGAGAADRRELRTAQLEHGVEPLRVPRHQNQQGVGMLRE